MTTSSTDLAYGRQGGRIVPTEGFIAYDAPVRNCAICRQPMLAGQHGVHFTCCANTGGRLPVCNVVTIRKRDGGGKVCGACWKPAA